MQFVVVTLGRCSTCTAQLYEWYRVLPGGPLRRRRLGRWSPVGGMDISDEDTWQRRRDLEGLQLNVAIVDVSVSPAARRVHDGASACLENFRLLPAECMTVPARDYGTFDCYPRRGKKANYINRRKLLKLTNGPGRRKSEE